MAQATTSDIKTIHEWTIPVTREVEETVEETRDGQTVKVIRKVTKEVLVKMGLKKLTRREAREADLFYGTQYNWFVTKGFLPRSILINKHLDISGGVLSEKERKDIAKLIERRVTLEADLVRATSATQTVQDDLRSQLHAVNSQLIDLNSANEAVFTQTAEAKAQNQLNSWLAFRLTMIERDGKWVPYFEGDTFEKQEEFMWDLEERNDEFYGKAVEKISLYVGLFVRGVNTPEQFKLIEEDMAKQLAEKQAADETATNKPAESSSNGDLPPDATDPVV
jgi:hypothetical protein